MARTKTTSTSKSSGTKRPTKKTSTGSSGGGGGRKEKDGVKKKRRFRPGTVALREIRRMQKSTDLQIPRAPFYRLIKKMTADKEETSERQFRYTRGAIDYLHEAVEDFLAKQFQMTNAATILAKRQTITPEFMRAANDIAQIAGSNGSGHFRDENMKPFVQIGDGNAGERKRKKKKSSSSKSKKSVEKQTTTTTEATNSLEKEASIHSEEEDEDKVRHEKTIKRKKARDDISQEDEERSDDRALHGRASDGHGKTTHRS